MGSSFLYVPYRYGSYWRTSEAEKNLLRTHTTAVSSRMLYRLAQEVKRSGTFRPAKYFSIDRVFRNEAIDRTHLAEFHQIEGACMRALKVRPASGRAAHLLSLLLRSHGRCVDYACCEDFTLRAKERCHGSSQVSCVIAGSRWATLSARCTSSSRGLGCRSCASSRRTIPTRSPAWKFSGERLGERMYPQHGVVATISLTTRFHQRFNTRLRGCSYSEELGKWIEVGNSGMFRPEMLRPMGLPEDVTVIAWGLSLER